MVIERGVVWGISEVVTSHTFLPFPTSSLHLLLTMICTQKRVLVVSLFLWDQFVAGAISPIFIALPKPPVPLSP